MPDSATPADQAAERLEALVKLSRGAFVRKLSDVIARHNVRADLRLILSERRKPDPLGEELDREAVARVIEPQAFHVVTGTTEWAWSGAWRLRENALAKADAIIALLPAEPSLVSPPPPLPPQLLALSKAAKELVAYARDVRAKTTPGAWAGEGSLDTPGWFDVWTMDVTGQRRIVIARHLSPAAAAFVCFASTGVPTLADMIDRLLTAIRSCESAGAESTPGEGR